MSRSDLDVTVLHCNLCSRSLEVVCATDGHGESAGWHACRACWDKLLEEADAAAGLGLEPERPSGLRERRSRDRGSVDQ